jgi:alpha-N-acetylglucosaminidase
MDGDARRAAAAGLVRRLLGTRADRVDIEMHAPTADGLDVVEIEASAGRLRLAGTTGVAVAVGLRHYLERACGVQVTWLDEPIPVPGTWPAMDRTRLAARFPLRYHLNYVTFAYSTVFWGWDRWEREIDRMALHGINAPLALTGHEAVWRAVLRAEGLPDDRIAAYLGGTTYLPFLWMGCLEEWDRPLPENWIAERERLGRRILARERELGMAPVLPGFAGHVPAELADENTGELSWEGFSTRQLPADHPRFLDLARRLRAEQRSRFGGDHHYAADPFIEMVPPSGDPAELARLAQRILDGIAVDDPDAVWVFQAWPFYYRSEFWTPERVRAFLEAVPADRLLVLDLWAEHLPLWSPTDGFAGRPWLWCAVHNFGERSGLFGDVRAIVDRFAAARDGSAGGRLDGIGLTMEGLGTNPAIYDLVTDLAWRDPPDDHGAWLTGWAARRYGTDDARIQDAWRLLAVTLYGDGRDVLPPSPVVRRPGLDDEVTQGWAPESGLDQLLTAWRLLLDAAASVRHTDAYERDLVDVAAQVLAGLAGRSRRAVTAAAGRGAQDDALAAGTTLLALLDDLEDLLATREEYLLGRWLADARAWGATPAERLHLERSARRLLTVWGHADTNLYDYAGKHWAGLVRGFYRPRFEVWLSWIADGGSIHDPASAVALDRRLASFEQLWILAGDSGPDSPRGSAHDIAAELFARWRHEDPPDSPVARP